MMVWKHLVVRGMIIINGLDVRMKQGMGMEVGIEERE